MITRSGCSRASRGWRRRSGRSTLSCSYTSGWAEMAKTPPLKAVAVASEAAEGAGQAIVKALTTPIHSRGVHEVWNDDTGEWVPDTRDKATNITPAGVLVGGLLALGAAAVAQRGIRTGTVTLKTQRRWTNPK